MKNRNGCKTWNDSTKQEEEKAHGGKNHPRIKHFQFALGWCTPNWGKSIASKADLVLGSLTVWVPADTAWSPDNQVKLKAAPFAHNVSLLPILFSNLFQIMI